MAAVRLVRDNHPENNSLSAVGRLEPGISLDQAREELSRSEPLDEGTLAGGAIERRRRRSPP